MEERINNEHEARKISIVDTAKKIFKSCASKLGNALIKFGEGDPTMPQPVPTTETRTSVINIDMSPLNTEYGIHAVGGEYDLMDNTTSEVTTDKDDTEIRQGEKKADEIVSGYKLVHKAVELIKEYDRCSDEALNDTAKILYNDAANKMIENLILSGCTPVNPQENESFDFSYHTTKPVSFPIDKKIKETIRLGIAIGDEVLIKAIVELK